MNLSKQDIKDKLAETKRKLVDNVKKARKNLTKSAGNYSHTRRVSKDRRTRKRAEKLARLPKSRLKRIVYYLNPKRAFQFWFSKRGMILGLKIAGVGIAIMIFVIIALFAYFRREIDADPKNLKASLLEQTTKFYDRSGKRVIYNLHGDTNRTWVELEDVSDHAEHATIAIEDKNFYHHSGFSITGVIRATISNIFGNDDRVQGGSTITQQFVKNAFLSNEKTFTRKIKELILALEIERLYTKEEILEFYLNQIPYGGTEYGIEAAAISFFGKRANNLSIDESAMLAALPQAPSALSPYGGDHEALITRQHVIIRAMQDQGYITEEEEAEALEVETLEKIVPLEEKNQFKNLVAPHYVVEVQRLLTEMFGEQLVLNGGLKVTTSLDYKLQNKARRAVRQNIGSVTSPIGGGSGDNVAVVAIAIDSGHVTAMVGSRDYNYPKYGAFNAALAKRQPGSSFKVYDYAGLFYNERWGPDSLIYDTRATFGNYAPRNFDNGFRGRMTVRQALGESRNIPAVKATYIAGLENVLDIARRMGNRSLADASQLGLSAALGAGEVQLIEHTAGYATLARSGKYLPPTYILKVENSAGEVLYEWEKPEAEEAIDPQVAYLVTEAILDDVARSGTFGRNSPNLVVQGLTHTVKTGTTNDSVDGWMMGYTKHMAIGTWVGNHDNKPMHTITSRQNGPTFTQFMRDAHEDLKDGPIYAKRPSGIKVVRLDSNTGYAATSASKNTRNGLFPSWHKVQEPPEGNVAYVIDTVSGNLATDCTPDLARKNVKGSKLWPELLPDDPLFGNWAKAAGYTSAEAPAATDDVHKCSDSKPVVEITSVVHEEGSSSYKINVTVSKGTHPLDELKFSVNGSTKKTQSISSSGSYSYTTTVGGSASSIKFGATVIDEVLYSSDDFETRQRPVLSDPDDGDSAIPAEFNWSSVTGAGSYELCYQEGGGAPTCHTVVGANTYTTPLTPGGSYTAWVEAFNSGSSLSLSPTHSFTLAP